MRRPGRFIAALVLVSSMLLVALPVSASVRQTGAGNVPFYARILDSDEWTAIIFYRPPSCVSDDFNLLDFFDIPRALDCGPITTDGFAVWKNGPDTDFAPIQLNLQGLGAVPIYFVKTSELYAAAKDDVLTIGELEALPSLIVGTATSYQEVLHPSEAARRGKITVVASGTLADGRSFRLQVSGTERQYHATIGFE